MSTDGKESGQSEPSHLSTSLEATDAEPREAAKSNIPPFRRSATGSSVNSIASFQQSFLDIIGEGARSVAASTSPADEPVSSNIDTAANVEGLQRSSSCQSNRSRQMTSHSSISKLGHRWPFCLSKEFYEVAGESIDSAADGAVGCKASSGIFSERMDHLEPPPPLPLMHRSRGNTVLPTAWETMDPTSPLGEDDGKTNGRSSSAVVTTAAVSPSASPSKRGNAKIDDMVWPAASLFRAGEEYHAVTSQPGDMVGTGVLEGERQWSTQWRNASQNHSSQSMKEEGGPLNSYSAADSQAPLLQSHRHLYLHQRITTPLLSNPMKGLLSSVPPKTHQPAAMRGVRLFPRNRDGNLQTVRGSDGDDGHHLQATTATPLLHSLPSTGLSLQATIHEHGRLKLQEEAAQWFHRCQFLERELHVLREVYQRQTRLLTSGWLNQSVVGGPSSSPTTAAATKAVVETSLPSPNDAVSIASHSPYSPSHRYRYEMSAVAEVAMAELSSAASPPADSLTPLLASFETSAATAAAQARLFLASSTAVHAADSRADERSANDGVRSGLVERQEVESPLIASSDAPTPLPPSAIMIRQLAESTEAVEAMRRRLEEAEVEMVMLRENAAEQQLRCEDLETQLLGKEEQLFLLQQQKEPQPQQERQQLVRELLHVQSGVGLTGDSPDQSCKLQHLDLLADTNCFIDTFIQCANSVASFPEEVPPLSDLVTTAAGLSHRIKVLLPDRGVPVGGAEPTSLVVDENSHRSSVDTCQTHSQPASISLECITEIHRGLMSLFATLGRSQPTSSATMANVSPTAAGEDGVVCDSTNGFYWGELEDANSNDNGEVAALSGATLSKLLRAIQAAVESQSLRLVELSAELDVVRADRNELIGEQSEQVRLLQTQLLQKEEAQLLWMQRFQEAQSTNAQLRTASAATVAPQSTSSIVSKVEQASQTDGKDGAQAVQQAVDAALKEAKVRADTSLQAQKAVFTDRLTQLEKELRQCQLHAEEEYDGLTEEIDRLTRELASTKDALRVKETSLRIALRQASPLPSEQLVVPLSFPSPLSVDGTGEVLALQGPPTGAGGALVASSPPSTVKSAATDHRPVFSIDRDSAAGLDRSSSKAKLAISPNGPPSSGLHGRGVQAHGLPHLSPNARSSSSAESSPFFIRSELAGEKGSVAQPFASSHGPPSSLRDFLESAAASTATMAAAPAASSPLIDPSSSVPMGAPSPLEVTEAIRGGFSPVPSNPQTYASMAKSGAAAPLISRRVATRTAAEDEDFLSPSPSKRSPLFPAPRPLAQKTTLTSSMPLAERSSSHQNRGSLKDPPAVVSENELHNFSAAVSRLPPEKTTEEFSPETASPTRMTPSNSTGGVAQLSPCTPHRTGVVAAATRARESLQRQREVWQHQEALLRYVSETPPSGIASSPG